MGYLMKPSRLAARQRVLVAGAKSKGKGRHGLYGANRHVISAVHQRLLIELSDLGAWTYHVAQHGSTYVKFRDADMGSLRISDHGGREKYAYRWNLDGVSEPLCVEEERNGHMCYYFGLETIDDMIAAIRAWAVSKEADDDGLWD